MDDFELASEKRGSDGSWYGKSLTPNGWEIPSSSSSVVIDQEVEDVEEEDTWRPLRLTYFLRADPSTEGMSAGTSPPTA